MDSWFFLSFPAVLDSVMAGPEEAKNLGGGRFLRLIQDPL
jgi:hypothetical protein